MRYLFTDDPARFRDVVTQPQVIFSLRGRDNVLRTYSIRRDAPGQVWRVEVKALIRGWQPVGTITANGLFFTPPRNAGPDVSAAAVDTIHFFWRHLAEPGTITSIRVVGIQLEETA